MFGETNSTGCQQPSKIHRKTRRQCTPFFLPFFDPVLYGVFLEGTLAHPATLLHQFWLSSGTRPPHPTFLFRPGAHRMRMVCKCHVCAMYVSCNVLCIWLCKWFVHGMYNVCGLIWYVYGMYAIIWYSRSRILT